MSYLKGVVLHVASWCLIKCLSSVAPVMMMAIMEVLCPMDKAYLTASPAVDVLDEASVGWLWTRRSLRNFTVCFRQTLRKIAYNYHAASRYQPYLQNAPEDKG